jgi:hypothetical protein
LRKEEVVGKRDCYPTRHRPAERSTRVDGGAIPEHLADAHDDRPRGARHLVRAQIPEVVKSLFSSGSVALSTRATGVSAAFPASINDAAMDREAPAAM